MWEPAAETEIQCEKVVGKKHESHLARLRIKKPKEYKGIIEMVRKGAKSTAIQAAMSTSFEAVFRTKQARKTDQDEMVCFVEYSNDCKTRFGWEDSKIKRLWKTAKANSDTPRFKHKERGLLLQMEWRILVCADDIVGGTRTKTGKVGTVANRAHMKSMMGEASGFGEFGAGSRNTSGPLKLRVGKKAKASEDGGDTTDGADDANEVPDEDEDEEEDHSVYYASPRSGKGDDDDDDSESSDHQPKTKKSKKNDKKEKKKKDDESNGDSDDEDNRTRGHGKSASRGEAIVVRS